MRNQLKKKYLTEQHTIMYTALMELDLLLTALEKLPDELVLYTNVSNQGQILPVVDTQTVEKRKKELESGKAVLKARLGVIEAQLIQIWE